MKITDHTISDFKRNSEVNRHIFELVEAGLSSYNQEKHPDPTESPLTLSVQSDEGELVAGLIGSNAYGWMRIDMLWVEATRRNGDIGTALMEEAERIAIERGCTGVHLDTHSSQAPAFYSTLGYQPFGELPNYPNENKRIYYWKSLIGHSNDGSDEA